MNIRDLGGGEARADETKIISAISLDVLKTIKYVASQTPHGCFVEVGVWKGGSAYVLGMVAEEQGRNLYLYDTFEGMPYADPWDVHKVGDFSDTSLEAVAALIPHAIITKGVFPESAHPDMRKVAFAHIDCDQYRAIKESVEYLRPLMVEGGLMWFDDYGAIPASTRAVDEIFGDRIVKVASKAVVVF
jgi:O-methyltransferase